ncbi:hypothetical protein CMV_023730 [Castanea mollissima]|uniref:Uncharacterized protein n=1 Tax=Castanea mollissima TaxID=60419 RepID=A0A8J4QBR6_9ROSI|nr:hypothetical protein CMV_023730 [Castanea mollissima]
MVQEIPPNVDTDGTLHAIDLKGKTKVNWRDKHVGHIQVWNSRAQLLCHKARLKGDMSSAHPYFHWYGRVTWRFVDHTAAALLIMVATHKQMLTHYAVGNLEYKQITAILKAMNRLHLITAQFPLEDTDGANPEAPEDTRRSAQAQLLPTIAMVSVLHPIRTSFASSRGQPAGKGEIDETDDGYSRFRQMGSWDNGDQQSPFSLLWTAYLLQCLIPLNNDFAKELEAMGRQYPFQPLKYLRQTLRLTFEEGIQMLKDGGVEVDPLGDLNTEAERKLGQLVLEKYDTETLVPFLYSRAVSIKMNVLLYAPSLLLLMLRDMDIIGVISALAGAALVQVSWSSTIIML